MSEHSLRPARHSQVAPLGRSNMQRRWPYYAGAALLAVLVIAWIDGGEEPLHPIVQPLALSAGESGE